MAAALAAVPAPALPAPAHVFKIVVIGDGGVGKSALLRVNATGVFPNRYVATMGVEVHPIRFETSIGPIVLNCWDTAVRRSSQVSVTATTSGLTQRS